MEDRAATSVANLLRSLSKQIKEQFCLLATITKRQSLRRPLSHVGHPPTFRLVQAAVSKSQAVISSLHHSMFALSRWHIIFRSLIQFTEPEPDE
jgi:hypothetical protein